MTASEKLIAFIRNTFDTALYFAVMAVKENFRNYIRRAGPTGDPSRGMVILGNGPSLAEDLPRLIARREYEARDFMAVNFFAEDDRFEVVRPGYYVLSDPMFFRDSECRDRVAALYRTLDSKVTWPMTLYVQFYNPEKFDYRAALPNPRIRIVRFHTQVYRGFGSVGFWLSVTASAAPISARSCRWANTSPCYWVTGRSSSTGWIIRCSTGYASTTRTACAVPTATITMPGPGRRSLST